MNHDAGAVVECAVVELETPCLLLDQSKLENNIARLKKKFATENIDFRLHVKTSKCVEIAALVLQGLPKKITVSTLKEAEYFADHGFDDILYAVGIAPDKMERVLNLYERGVTVHVVLDSLDAAMQLQLKAPFFSCDVSVFIEIDSDDTRAGLKPDSQDLLAIADLINHTAGLKFTGVMTHAGSSYQASSPVDIQRIAEQERMAVVHAAERLEHHGCRCDIVSAGSTPTALFGTSFDGLTEFRAGVFIFNDLFQANLGVCEFADIAASVLCSVIGHQQDKNMLIIDAGALALSKDRGTQSQRLDCGYGLVKDAATDEVIKDWLVCSVSQEHGQIKSVSGLLDVKKFPIGTKLKILPNHVCMTAAPYAEYYVTEKDRVVAKWPKILGW